MPVYIDGKEVGTVIVDYGKFKSLIDGSIINIAEEDLAGVSAIKPGAFKNSTSLVSVDLPNSITNLGADTGEVGDGVFAGCTALTIVKLSPNIKQIFAGTFFNCSSLETLDIPEGIEILGGGVSSGSGDEFSIAGNSAIKSLSLPDSIKTLNRYAFYGMGELLTISNFPQITELADSLLGGCSKLTDFTIPTTTITIGQGCFSNCRALTEILVPESVISVGISAFSDCTGLNSVTFGGQAPNILNSTYSDCNSIIKYDFRNCNAIPTLASTSSLGHANGCQIIIPDALYDDWTTATNWVSLTNVEWVKASEVSE